MRWHVIGRGKYIPHYTIDDVDYIFSDLTDTDMFFLVA